MSFLNKLETEMKLQSFNSNDILKGFWDFTKRRIYEIKNSLNLPKDETQHQDSRKKSLSTNVADFPWKLAQCFSYRYNSTRQLNQIKSLYKI